MSKRTVYRVGGVAVSCGSKASARSADGCPTMAELRELAQRLNASNRRSRCGRPGRMDAPEFWARVEAKLAAAAKAGRGLRFLSRDEVDALVRALGKK